MLTWGVPAPFFSLCAGYEMHVSTRLLRLFAVFVQDLVGWRAQAVGSGGCLKPQTDHMSDRPNSEPVNPNWINKDEASSSSPHGLKQILVYAPPPPLRISTV